MLSLTVKTYIVIDFNHLKMYEQLYINKYKPVNRINTFNILAGIDTKNRQKVYRKENKSEYGKQRYFNNKEYFDNYIEENRDKINSPRQHRVNLNNCLIHIYILGYIYKLKLTVDFFVKK